MAQFKDVVNNKLADLNKGKTIKIRVRPTKAGLQLWLDWHENKKRRNKTLNGLVLIDKPRNREKNKEHLRYVEIARDELERKRFLDENFDISVKEQSKELLVERMKQCLNDKAPQTQKNWVVAIKQLESSEYKDLRLKDIDRSVLNSIKVFFMNGGKKNSTVNKLLEKVLTTMQEAIRNSEISHIDLTKLKLKEEEPERIFLTKEEVLTLEKTPIGEHLQYIKDAFLFSCYTGLRSGDVANLEPKNVKIGEVRIQQKKTKDFISFPLSNKAQSILQKVSASPILDKLFYLPSNAHHLSLHLRKWARKAGVEKEITFHCARRTYATLLISAGADLYVVKDLMGHKEIKQTQIYAKILDQRKNEVVVLFDKYLI